MIQSSRTGGKAAANAAMMVKTANADNFGAFGSDPQDWAFLTAYDLGVWIHPSTGQGGDTSFIYECTQAGSSDVLLNQPAWSAATYNDGTVIWTRRTMAYYNQTRLVATSFATSLGAGNLQLVGSYLTDLFMPYYKAVVTLNDDSTVDLGAVTTWEFYLAAGPFTVARWASATPFKGVSLAKSVTLQMTAFPPSGTVGAAPDWSSIGVTFNCLVPGV
jgi:hypothetical protein